MLVNQETPDALTLTELISATPWSRQRMPLQSLSQLHYLESSSARSLHYMQVHSMCDISSWPFKSDLVSADLSQYVFCKEQIHLMTSAMCEKSQTQMNFLEFLLHKRSRPDTCQQVALAEAICHQLPREVWRILSHGLLLTECLPTNGLMTVNLLALCILSTSLVQQPPPSTGRPCISFSLQAGNF